jgi:hypothetical protein
MKNNSTMSRRGLLAGVPAIAVAVGPAAATALSGLPAAIPAPTHDAAIQEMLGRMPPDERRAVLTAVKEAIECSMRCCEDDAELLVLKPEFDEVFDGWRRQFQDPPRHAASEEENDRFADRLYGLADQVLGHRPRTRDGCGLNAVR